MTRLHDSPVEEEAASSLEEEAALSLLSAPAFDERALVFAIEDPDAAEAAADHTIEGIASAGEVELAGLDAACAYVARHRGAELTPLFEERSPKVRCGDNWKLAIPDPESSGGRLSGIHYLRLASPEHSAMLEDALRRDRRLTHVHRPAIQYPVAAPAGYVAADPGRQWGLVRCGFPLGWQLLERGDDPGPIGIIDAGGAPSHPDLEGCIAKYVPPPRQSGAPSKSIHAGAIAGVIAAKRGNDDGRGMAGCCSAKLHLYNVWTNERFDSKAYYDALKAVAAARLPVLNLSLGSRVPDPTLDEAIRGCIDRGVVVVAAMGDYAPQGSPPIFPAANEGVVAVGATDSWDRKFEFSSTGSHIWLSAPGESIWTVYGDEAYRPQSGTSFATAMVSAAAWLARRAQPDSDPDRIRDLLARSVDGRSVPDGGHSPELGHGRLDVLRLASLCGVQERAAASMACRKR